MNPSTAVATVFVDELIRGGLRHAVLSPGSRSTPFALAFYAAAEAGRLQLHVRVDERSAGFLALGLAKVSRRPTVALTTSGTAAANLHPAVIEADLAGVPLVALTADRPPELRGTGANQTIDQIKLFGSAVRLFAEVGAPEERSGQNTYWRGLVSRALAEATGAVSGMPGPVHLNVALREPLVPSESTPWAEELSGRREGSPWTRTQTADRPRSDISLPARTLVVVGDCSPSEGSSALRLAEENGWPIISEPTGNASSGPHAISTGGWLLGEPVWDDLLPESILVVGRPTLSRTVNKALADPRVSTFVTPTAGQWSDSARNATHVLSALPQAHGHRSADAAWLARWQSAEASARKALDAALDSHPDSEQSLVRSLHAALPTDALLVTGSSLPVRHVFLCARPRDGVTVVANRGAAGIDGTTSTAVGAATAWQEGGGGPAVALVGDLTFLHDANGLLFDRSREPQLTVVVLNNDGGGIFEQLEQGSETDRGAFETVLGTPTGVDLAALCGTTGTSFTRASSGPELSSVVTDPRAGFQVVETRTERGATASLHATIGRAISAAVAP